MFKAKCNYDGQGPDELTFQAEDRIFCTPTAYAFRGDEWIIGENLETGEQGLFPSNFVDRIAETFGWALHAVFKYERAHFDPGMVDHSRIDWNTRIDPTYRAKRMTLRRDTVDDYANTSIDSNIAVQPWNPNFLSDTQLATPERKLFVMRHMERVDKAFGDWLPYSFDRYGFYRQIDVNLPYKLADRENRTLAPAQEWAWDPPLTEIGKHQAYLMGREFRRALGSLHLRHIYCSPSYRCVTTAKHFLRGYNCQTHKIKIRIEPGLYEWHDNRMLALPTFMPAEALRAENIDIDGQYQPVYCIERLQDTLRQERKFAAVYERHSMVTKRIIDLENDHTLIIAHALNLETCTCKLLGNPEKSYVELLNKARYIPYGAMVALEENPSNEIDTWIIPEQFIMPMTHTRNFPFEWSNMRK